MALLVVTFPLLHSQLSQFAFSHRAASILPGSCTSANSLLCLAEGLGQSPPVQALLAHLGCKHQSSLLRTDFLAYEATDLNPSEWQRGFPPS